MTRVGITVSVLVAAATAVGAFVLTSASTGRASSEAGAQCPTHLYPASMLRPDRTVEAVIRSARRQIPVAYRGAWVNQSGIVKLTPSTYDVTAVFWAGLRGRYFREAARACGKRVATASWVVVFSVPEAESAMLSTGTAFLAPTGPRRWRLWDAR